MLACLYGIVNKYAFLFCCTNPFWNFFIIADFWQDTHRVTWTNHAPKGSPFPFLSHMHQTIDFLQNSRPTNTPSLSILFTLTLIYILGFSESRERYLFRSCHFIPTILAFLITENHQQFLKIMPLFQKPHFNTRIHGPVQYT